MSSFWKSFLNEFCKVEAVCFEGDPNWLGWILVGLLGLFLIIASLYVWALLDSLWQTLSEQVGSVVGEGAFGSIVYFFFIGVSALVVILVVGVLANFLVP